VRTVRDIGHSSRNPNHIPDLYIILYCIIIYCIIFYTVYPTPGIGRRQPRAPAMSCAYNGRAATMSGLFYTAVFPFVQQLIHKNNIWTELYITRRFRRWRRRSRWRWRRVYTVVFWWIVRGGGGDKRVVSCGRWSWKKITEGKRKIVLTPRRRPTIMRHVMWYAPLETQHSAM